MPIMVNYPEFYSRCKPQIDNIRKFNVAKLLFSLGCFACCIAMSVLILYYNQAFIIIPYIGSIIAICTSIMNIVVFSSEQRITTFTKNPVGYRYGVSFSDIPIAIAFGMYIYLSIVTSNSPGSFRIRAVIISFTVLSLLTLLMSTAYEITMKRIVTLAIVHTSLPPTVVTGATVGINQTTYPTGYAPNAYGGNYGQQYPQSVVGQPPQNMPPFAAPPMQPMQAPQYPPNTQIPAQVPPAYSEIEKQAPPPPTSK